MARSCTVYARNHTIPQRGLDTGIAVTAGDLLNITPNSGQTWECYGPRPNGPDGGGHPAFPFGTNNSFSCGALVGSLNNGQSYFAIGNGYRSTASTSGTLRLYAWDDGPDDNTGSMTVQVSVESDRRLVVKATDTWLDTGVEVKSGERLIITATGTWKVDSLPATIEVTADGYGEPFGGTPLDASFASLIGRIGDNGAPFFVGSDFNQPSSGSGRLYLQINDAVVSDNVGELVVIIKIQRT